MRLVDYAASRLERLCTAARFQDERPAVVRTFRDLVSPWGDRNLGTSNGWISDISDDNTPVEFSVAMAGQRTEVRVLFEPQANEPTLAAYRREGLAFHERIARDYGADLSRFRLLEDVFLPPDLQGAFAVWSSVVFPRGGAPAFKTYFNPQARGPEHARRLVEIALDRLGMHSALAHLEQTALRRGELDEVKYFALDLTRGATSRIKVYVRHHAASATDLELAASAASSYVPGETVSFVRAMRGGDERLDVRGPFTCSAFTEGDGPQPSSTTVYVPVCAYARDDSAVRERIRSYMLERAIDPTRYQMLVDGYANRPLDAGVGMQAWFAIRTHDQETRFTVYLATEARRVHAPGEVPAPTSPVIARTDAA